MGQAHPGLSFFAKAVHLRAVTGVAAQPALPYVDKGGQYASQAAAGHRRS